jgi:4-hydroxythreonine-4-phosphate dehydrogenase
MPISPSGKARIALTLGDPAGIGPEVALKAVSHLNKKAAIKFLLLGKARFYQDLAKKLKIKMLFKDILSPSDWGSVPPGAVACHFSADIPKNISRGKYDSRLATLAVHSIKLGASLCMSGQADALVTAPINKASTQKAGFDIPGHTELLAALSKTKRYEMMLVGGKLRVVLVTRHMALKEVSAKVTRARVKDTIALTITELHRSFGLKHPRIVVCGLNPHAGEEGRFGREEIRVIAPAVREAKKIHRNAEIIGPLSPDALFCDAYEGRYDAEICMYHDQGLIPLKMISRGAGVNVTLGLPFVRTSPDHGTAYDIAGKFIADPGSMIEAVNLSVTLVKNRRHYAGPIPRS